MYINVYRTLSYDSCGDVGQWQLVGEFACRMAPTEANTLTFSSQVMYIPANGKQNSE
jgi:hypothetical protein